MRPVILLIGVFLPTVRLATMFTIAEPLRVTTWSENRSLGSQIETIAPDGPGTTENILAIERIPSMDVQSRLGRIRSRGRRRLLTERILQEDPAAFEKVAVRLYYRDTNGSIKIKFADILRSKLVESTTFLSAQDIQRKTNESLSPPFPSSCGDEYNSVSLVLATPKILKELAQNISRGNGERVREILTTYNIDINTKLTDKEETPLSIAVSKNESEMVAMLLRFGADADIRNKKGEALLMEAVRRNRIAVARVLISYTNIKNSGRQSDGWSVLHEAAKKELTGIIPELLQHGADLNALQKHRDQTPLHVGVKSGNVNVARALLSRGGAKMDIRMGFKRRTALFFAAERGDKNMVRLLLRHKADHELPNWRGHTPLQTARNNGHDDVVEEIESFLLESTTFLSAQDIQRKTNESLSPPFPSSCGDEYNSVSLVLATPKILKELAQNISRGNGERVREILTTYNIDINTKLTDKEETPLSIAVSKNESEMVAMLLRCGADADIRNKKEETPLSIAVSKNESEMVAMLLRFGADADIRNKKGEALLMEAVRRNRIAVARVLISYTNIKNSGRQSDGWSVLHEAAKKELTGIIPELLQHGADLNALQKYRNQTPLHVGVESGNVNVARALLSRGGAKMDIRIGFKRKTALFFAAERGDKNMVRLLLRHKADHKVPNWRGRTPLQTARNNGHDDVVEEIESFLQNNRNAD